jgi:hypothetical protein
MTKDELVAIGKKMILKDMSDGIVPSDVSDFQTLHEFADANAYITNNFQIVNDLNLLNDVSQTLNAWLVARSKKTYILLGEDAVSEYEENGADGVIEEYEADEIGYEVKVLDDSMSVAEILYASQGFYDYLIITKEDFYKLNS